MSQRRAEGSATRIPDFKIEQPGSLNQLLSGSPDEEKAARRRSLKLAAPIWVFIVVLTFEQILLAGATHKSPLSSSQGLAIASLASLAIIGFLWVIARITVWDAKRRKRTLSLTDKGIELEPRKHSHLPWASIGSIQIEPISESPDHTLLTIRIGPDSRPFHQQSWPMVLESAQVKARLLAQLSGCVDAGKIQSDQIIVHANKAPTEPSKPVANLWFWMFGMLLLVHGLPVLFMGPAMWSDDHELEKRRVQIATEVQQEIEELNAKAVPHDQIPGLARVLRIAKNETAAQRHMWVCAAMTFAGMSFVCLAGLAFCMGYFINWRNRLIWMWENHPDLLAGK